MTDEKKNAGDPFTGLPSEILIGEVLQAATEASEQVKRSGTEYPDLADPGKGDPENRKQLFFHSGKQESFGMEKKRKNWWRYRPPCCRWFPFRQ